MTELAMLRPYVRTEPTPESMYWLGDLARATNIGTMNRLHYLHCTIMHSTTSIEQNLAQKALSNAGLFPAEALELEIFENAKHINLVLKLRSPALIKRHEFWKSLGCGYTTEFEYTPHVTLITDPEATNPFLDRDTARTLMEEAIEKLKPKLRDEEGNLRQLVFYREYLEPVKE